MNGPLADLHDSYGRDGYLGGLRLLQATCKKFYQASFSCPVFQNIVFNGFFISYSKNRSNQIHAIITCASAYGEPGWRTFLSYLDEMS